MKQYVIEGGKKLEGTVRVSGSKNASLPILAASILAEGTTTLYQVPQIRDTKITLEILGLLGCKIKRNNDKIEINSRNMNKAQIPEEQMRQMRSTVVLAGAILGRFKEAVFSYPGGCDIGARPIDLHISAFRKMGVNVKEEAGYIQCKCDELMGADIHLEFPSVGATENILLAAVKAKGKTTITNAAMEPEIIDLVQILRKMGAQITGEGTNVIEIIGVDHLKQTSYQIMPDRIEAGTLLCFVTGTGGKIELQNAEPLHMVPILEKLEEAGCFIQKEKNTIYLEAPKRLKAINLKTMPYPGFPTDMQSVFGGMLTMAKGTSVITENIFENRFRYCQELKRMGAKIDISGQNAIIKGVRKLSGAKVESTDLRGGASLIMASLMAKGISKIQKIEYIARGYENIEQKLKCLGAKIKQEEGD